MIIPDINKRFLKTIKKKGYSGYKISKEVDVITESKLTHLRKGTNKVSGDMISALLEKFSDIDPEWLLTGNGEMLRNGEVAEASGEKKGVPYYNIDFTASFGEVQNNQQTQPDSYVSHPFFANCDYIVRASGQSMAKVISNGDAIGLLEVKSWRDFFPFGEIYAIVTVDDYRMIKIITKGETDDTFTLISKPTDAKKNEFPPQQIKRDSIRDIFKVQASSRLF